MSQWSMQSLYRYVSIMVLHGEKFRLVFLLLVRACIMAGLVFYLLLA